MANLKLNAVNKVYPSGTLALYDGSFETEEKEFIVIVGAEESGKSTLLRMIAGLEDVSSGKIFIGNKDVTELEPKDRDIAMISNSNTLYPALNVYDNMAFGLKIRKAPQVLIDQRVKAAANILGLGDILFRKPKALSSAQKQRVAIARAIVREPKLYLFDEPLSGLDSKLKAELLNVIINLQARMEGTFVYATKNVGEALSIGTRIIVMKNGFVQQIDTPANLYDYPANTYVAFYIGSPTINFINHAKIVKTDEGIFAVDKELKIKLPQSITDRFASLSEYVDTDKEVIVGVRPEDISACEGKCAKVEKTESGYAEIEYFGHSLIVTANGVKPGEKADVSIDGDRLHLFDGETRLTLLSRDGGYKNSGHADADYKPLSYVDEEEYKNKLKPKKVEKKKR